MTLNQSIPVHQWPTAAARVFTSTVDGFSWPRAGADVYTLYTSVSNVTGGQDFTPLVSVEDRLRGRALVALCTAGMVTLLRGGRQAEQISPHHRSCGHATRRNRALGMWFPGAHTGSISTEEGAFRGNPGVQQVWRQHASQHGFWWSMSKHIVEPQSTACLKRRNTPPCFQVIGKRP